MEINPFSAKITSSQGKIRASLARERLLDIAEKITEF